MFPVWHAYSRRVWWVSRSTASMSVVSSSRSSMFMRTVPFLVTICFRLKVLCFSRGGSNAVLRSAKGSGVCPRASLPGTCPMSSCIAEGCRPCCESESEGEEALWPRPGCRPPVPDRWWRPLAPMLPRLPGRLPSCGAAPACLPLLLPGRELPSVDEKARLAGTGLKFEPSLESTPMSRIFMRAFSIFRAVTFSSTWKATSSGFVSRTWGWPVSWRKRHSARMTCVTSSAPLGGSLALPRDSFTCASRPCGTTAWEAATRPSFPWRSRRSRGMSLLVVCRSMTAVMK
mmetsp:Transcript_57827/g.181575  ORF Transcript_57827/g.181575 Transcript_57827/m.181575 type:complete len:287 (+) Transcript_57827:663-1523(+)